MPRRAKQTPRTPAQAMEAAMAGLARELRVTPADKCGPLARQLAALAKDLAAERDAEAARAAATAEPDPEEAARRQREFDAEMERLIEARVEERVEWALRGKAEHEAWVEGVRGE